MSSHNSIMLINCPWSCAAHYAQRSGTHSECNVTNTKLVTYDNKHAVHICCRVKTAVSWETPRTKQNVSENTFQRK